MFSIFWKVGAVIYYRAFNAKTVRKRRCYLLSFINAKTFRRRRCYSICYRSLMRKLSAGGAVITNPPMNQNKTEGDMVNFHCQGEGTPGNGSTS